MDVTVIIPTIEGREELLRRAAESVATAAKVALRDAGVSVTLTIGTDAGHSGAAAARDRVLTGVTAPWVATLDDDDEWAPDHLAGLAAAAQANDADLAYTWYEIVGPSGMVEQWRDPHAAWEGVPWDPDSPRQVPSTILARTDLLRAVGGWTDYGRWTPATAGRDENGNRVGEDTLLGRRVNDIGARIVHVPARTYRWHHHGGNTSGWAH